MAKIIIGLFTILLMGSIGVITHLKPEWVYGKGVIIDSMGYAILDLFIFLYIVVVSLSMLPSGKNKIGKGEDK